MPQNLRHVSIEFILSLLNVVNHPTISLRKNINYLIPTLKVLLPTWLEKNALENWTEEDKIKKQHRIQTLVEVFMLQLLLTTSAIACV